jgi:hypothetical protein
MLSAAAFGVFGLSGTAQAAILDLESVTPAIYFSGETFGQAGYTFTQQGGFGAIGAAFDIAQAPVGNDTQFYGGLNDASLSLTGSDLSGFNLYSFDAGFIAPSPQGPDVFAGRIVLFGTTTAGGNVLSSFEFLPSAADGSFSFAHYALGLDAFRNLASVTFLACIYGEDGLGCNNPAANLAQFALDNVAVIAVPEPSTHALFLLGLAGVAAYSRRRARH